MLRSRGSQLQTQIQSSEEVGLRRERLLALRRTPSRPKSRRPFTTLVGFALLANCSSESGGTSGATCFSALNHLYDQGCGIVIDGEFFSRTEAVQGCEDMRPLVEECGCLRQFQVGLDCYATLPSGQCEWCAPEIDAYNSCLMQCSGGGHGGNTSTGGTSTGGAAAGGTTADVPTGGGPANGNAGSFPTGGSPDGGGGSSPAGGASADGGGPAAGGVGATGGDGLGAEGGV